MAPFLTPPDKLKLIDDIRPLRQLLSAQKEHGFDERSFDLPVGPDIKHTAGYEASHKRASVLVRVASAEPTYAFCSRLQGAAHTAA